MKFEAGLENEDSFMIIPNEFVKDHELTREEAEALTKPDEEYEREILSRYGGWLFKRTYSGMLKHFFRMDMRGKIIFLKKACNHILGRKLPKTEYKSLR